MGEDEVMVVMRGDVWNDFGIGLDVVVEVCEWGRGWKGEVEGDGL